MEGLPANMDTVFSIACIVSSFLTPWSRIKALIFVQAMIWCLVFPRSCRDLIIIPLWLHFLFYVFSLMTLHSYLGTAFPLWTIPWHHFNLSFLLSRPFTPVHELCMMAEIGHAARDAGVRLLDAHTHLEDLICDAVRTAAPPLEVDEMEEGTEIEEIEEVEEKRNDVKETKALEDNRFRRSSTRRSSGPKHRPW